MIAPNTTDSHASSDELVRLFIDETTRYLTALPVTPSLRCAARVRQLVDDDWVDAGSTPVTSWFVVTVNFSSDAVEGSFGFGDRENAIWAEARPAGSDASFALGEWSALLGRVPGPWEGGDWVYEPERLRTIVQAFADALREMHNVIAGADATERARLASAREARSGEDAERARVRDQERDEVQAAAAFRSGDYPIAVRLLSKHAAHLSPAQQRKLALAQSKLSSPALDHVVSTTIQVDAPADVVWSAITSPAALIQWYAPGCRWEIPALREGATVQFYNTDTDIQSAIIERCVQPAAFVLRWTPDASLPQTTLVNSYVLKSSGDGTAITISQTGYASVPADQRAQWIKADEGAFPAIAAALADFLSKSAN